MILNPFHNINPILMLAEGSANISGTSPIVDGFTNISTPSFWDMFLQKLVEVAGILVAGVLIFVAVLALLHFFGWLVRVRGRKWGKAKILFDTTPDDRSELNRVYQIYMSVVNRNQQIHYLLQFLPPLWLLTIANINLSQLFQASNPDRETVNLKLGPAEIKQVERLWNRLFSWGRIYRLKMLLIDGKYYLSMESKAGIELYHKLENLDEDLERAVTQILAITGTRGSDNSPANQELVAGLLTMSRFFVSPFKIEYLKNAIEHFDRASVWPTLHLKVQLMTLCCLQLSQSSPTETQTETRKRIAKLQEDPSILKKYHLILNYQQALAEFYTYTPQGYKESERLFKTIEKPNFFARLGAKVGFASQKRKLLLYLLARANLAIMLAHIIPTNDKERNRLDRELKETLEMVEQNINTFGYKSLGLALNDVHWRLLNAPVARAYNRRESSEEVITQARQALSIAPYALDVKANLGTLYTLESDKQTDEEKRNEYLKKAQDVFFELSETGWDPGYVYYRIAKIYYIKGNDEEALRYANKAKDPFIRDVFGPLDQLIESIEQRKKQLDKDKN